MAGQQDPPGPDAIAAVIGACVCANFRRTSRAVTQVFDEILEPSGLRSTQFIILGSIGADEPTTHARLAEKLVMDGSTVTRNLKPLVAKGLVRKTRASGSRLLSLTLTDAGRRAVADTLPLWQTAQRRFIDAIGDENWDRLRRTFDRTVDAARPPSPAV